MSLWNECKVKRNESSETNVKPNECVAYGLRWNKINKFNFLNNEKLNYIIPIEYKYRRNYAD